MEYNYNIERALEREIEQRMMLKRIKEAINNTEFCDHCDAKLISILRINE